METLGHEFAVLAIGPEWLKAIVRLAVAALLGGVLGYERQRVGKTAGTRTHMLVSLGSAVFVLIMVMAYGTGADVSRVIQGALTGMGFIGAGAILKYHEEQVRGLTTAAGIWLATGVGLAAGMGQYPLALLGTVFGFIILSLFRHSEVTASRM